MSLKPAQVKVRVQARDGKILGPASTVTQPFLTVRNVLTGEELIPRANFNHDASGTVLPSSQFKEDVSRNAIVLEPPGVSPTYPKGPYWLEVPTADQGGLIVELPLTEPSLLEFKATAFAPDPVYASATMWVTPGLELLEDPGLVLTIAGLYTTVDAIVSGNMVSLIATVTMMCGCPITSDPSHYLPPDTEPYWPSYEFDVHAEFHPQDSPEVAAPLDLTCIHTNTFAGTVKSLRAGTYDVWVVTVQKRETNVGFARTTITVT
ncbi:MAG TPA: hypothetical protein VGS22_10555 [Thermoanaerobaculia bacterium]|jgi:hypothetical protein|nr:hypothetical protein [Thermoanaerobaculia bacterium]